MSDTRLPVAAHASHGHDVFAGICWPLQADAVVVPDPDYPAIDYLADGLMYWMAHWL